MNKITPRRPVINIGNEAASPPLMACLSSRCSSCQSQASVPIGCTDNRMFPCLVNMVSWADPASSAFSRRRNKMPPGLAKVLDSMRVNVSPLEGAKIDCPARLVDSTKPSLETTKLGIVSWSMKSAMIAKRCWRFLFPCHAMPQRAVANKDTEKPIVTNTNCIWVSGASTPRAPHKTAAPRSIRKR